MLVVIVTSRSRLETYKRLISFSSSKVSCLFLIYVLHCCALLNKDRPICRHIISSEAYEYTESLFPSPATVSLLSASSANINRFFISFFLTTLILFFRSPPFPHELVISADFNVHLDNPADHFTSMGGARNSNWGQGVRLGLMTFSSAIQIEPSWLQTRKFVLSTPSHSVEMVYFRQAIAGDIQNAGAIWWMQTKNVRYAVSEIENE